MRIEYELKHRDYLLFTNLHQLLSVPVQIAYGGFSVLVFVMYIRDESAIVSAIAALIVYVAMWTVQILFNVFYLFFGTYRSLLTKHVNEIQDEAFYDETSFGKSYHYWSGIAKIVCRAGFIAVYINANAAHIIPSRAFSSVDQRQLFLETLKGKLHAAC